MSQAIISKQDMYDQMMLTHMKKWMVTTKTQTGTTIGWTSATSNATTAYTNTINISTTPIKVAVYPDDMVEMPNSPDNYGGRHVYRDKDGRLQLRAGDKVVLPDGTEIILDATGNYVINDSDAKVVYRANRSRDFNRYINASDLLEEFLRYLRSMGVKRKEVMKVDLGVFISWLIIAAAEADQIDKPQEEVLMIEHHVKRTKLQPKCKCCAKFIPKRNAEAGVFFCNGAEMDRYREKIAA